MVVGPAIIGAIPIVIGVCGAANLGPQGNNIGLWAMGLDKSASLQQSQLLTSGRVTLRDCNYWSLNLKRVVVRGLVLFVCG